MNKIISGEGNDNNHAHPDTSMKLGRNVNWHELLEVFLVSQSKLVNFQNGGAKIQDGCHNKRKILKRRRFYIIQRNKITFKMVLLDEIHYKRVKVFLKLANII